MGRTAREGGSSNCESLSVGCNHHIQEREKGIHNTLHNLTCDFDVFLASHKDQNVTWWQSKMNLKDLFHGAIDIIFARGFRVEDFNGEGSSWNCVGRRISVEAGELIKTGSETCRVVIKKFCYLLGIHSCGCHNEFEITTSS